MKVDETGHLMYSSILSSVLYTAICKEFFLKH